MNITGKNKFLEYVGQALILFTYDVLTKVCTM